MNKYGDTVDRLGETLVDPERAIAFPFQCDGVSRPPSLIRRSDDYVALSTGTGHSVLTGNPVSGIVRGIRHRFVTADRRIISSQRCSVPDQGKTHRKSLQDFTGVIRYSVAYAAERTAGEFSSWMLIESRFLVKNPLLGKRAAREICVSAGALTSFPWETRAAALLLHSIILSAS